MKKRYKIALAICIVAIVGAIAWPLLSPREPVYHGKNTVMYKGKPLEAWFYGSNTTFYNRTTRNAAQEAINAAGANAFPFLLAKLEDKRGDGALYAGVYRAMPAWIKRRLPDPLSGDAIRYVTFLHLWAIRDRLTREQLEALADGVPSVRDPGLRIKCLRLLTDLYQSDPGFLRMCRRLLNDEDFGIELEAALRLVESGIASDLAEPRLFSLLLPALKSYSGRKPWLHIQLFALPGLPKAYSADQDDMLQSRLRSAFEKLAPYLTPEQRARLNQVDKPNLNEPQQIR